MNIKRLAHLITVLERVRNYKYLFDMCTWTTDPNRCGTAHCAFGWAAVDDEFQKEGLKLTKDGQPYYDAEMGFDAAEKFFAISRGAAGYLFDPAAYDEPYSQISPDQVIEHIKEVMGGYLD